MKQPTISNLQFTIINDCITTLCQSPRTLTKSIIPTPLTVPTLHHSHSSHFSHSLPVRLAPPTAPTIPIPSTPPFRLVPLRGSLREQSMWGGLSSFVTRHSSLVIRHSSFVIRPSSFVPRHSSFVSRHSSFVSRHSSLGDFQSSSENSIDYTIFNNFFRLVPLRKFERHLLTFNT